MKGRKRTLTLVKKAKRTLRPCRENPDAPQAPADLAKAPFCDVSPRCSVLFGMIVSWAQSVGVASSAYTCAISLLAIRLEDIEICNESVKANGMQYAKVELPTSGSSTPSTRATTGPTSATGPRPTPT